MRVSKFDHISNDVIAFAQNFDRDALPDFKELAELAQVSSIAVRVIVLEEQGKCCGVFCGFIESKRVGGIPMRCYSIFGHDFFDYCPVHFKPGYREALIAEIVEDAKASDADCVFLKGILLTDDSPLQAGALYSSPTHIFRQSIEDSGFALLLKKKSVKRHVNKCKREFEYNCEHFTDDQIQSSDIDEMGKLHIETRRYHSTPSAFTSPDTSRRYLTSAYNRVLTKISAGEEVIAYHYGLICGNTMIWHTPVVNIRFLEYSPLEVLLFEAVSYCEARGLDVFDLGEGDEPYKKRFSNDLRPVFDLIVPIKIKGRLARTLKDIEDRLNLRNRKEDLVNKVQEEFRAYKARFSKLYIYATPADFETQNTNSELLIIEDFASLVYFSRSSGMPLNRDQFNKMKSGLALCALTGRDGSAYSCCWISRGDSMYIPELDRKFDTNGKLVLVGFQSSDSVQPCDINLLTGQISAHFAGTEIVSYAVNIDWRLNRQLLSAGFIKADSLRS
jgi:Acetyltransferase (GNAT) domain